MPPKIKYIEFAPLGSGTIVDEEGIPILQLGIQGCSVEEKQVPKKYRGRYRYYLLRIASTFGRNKKEIKEGRFDLRLKSPGGRVVAHDMYPRREEEIKEAEVEVGLDASLTWGLIKAVPKLAYKTKMRRIDTHIVAGGPLTSSPWWKFKRRRGEDCIIGTIETLIVLQADYKEIIVSKAKLTGYTPRLLRKRVPTSVVFTFII